MSEQPFIIEESPLRVVCVRCGKVFNLPSRGMTTVHAILMSELLRRHLVEQHP
jgi:hypothetical protein